MTGVTNHGLRYPDGASKAKNLGPELQQFAEDVDGFIDREIDANSATFVEQAGLAAGKAVEKALDTSPRIPELGQTDAFRVIDSAGREAFGVRPTGATFVNGPVEAPDSGFRITDLLGRVAFEITSEGRTIITDLASAGAAGTSVTRVRCVIGSGQSLGSGRGRPLLPDVDTPMANLFQVGHTNRTLRQATSPLDMQDAPSGISPLWVYGVEAARTAGPGEVIVLIPAARGGTGLVSEASPNGCWHPDYAGPNRQLFALMTAQIADAIRLIGTQWPAARIVWEAFLWNQGEYDAQQGISQAAYAAAFDLVIARVRAQVGTPVPVIIGQSVPEWQLTEAGAPAIQAAQVDTLARVERTAFVYAAPDGSNYNDLIHPARGAVTAMGRDMFAARVEAVANVAGTEPVAPADVRAVRTPAALRVTWARPLCRVSSYIVRYRVNGGAWQAIARASLLDRVAVLANPPAGAIEVQVQTVIGTATSPATTPVPAIGN